MPNEFILIFQLKSVGSLSLFYFTSTPLSISYMKRVTSPGSMQDTGCLGLMHWDDPEGWYGEGGGRGGSGLGSRVHPWQIHVDV